MIDFESEMRQYKDKYWCLKESDGIYYLVNHNMYMVIRKGDDKYKTKQLVTIGPYDLEGKLYQVCTLNSSTGRLNSVKRKLTDKGLQIVKWVGCDGEALFVFNNKDLDTVAEVVKLKVRSKRELSEEQREAMRERFKNTVKNVSGEPISDS